MSNKGLTDWIGRWQYGLDHPCGSVSAGLADDLDPLTDPDALGVLRVEEELGVQSRRITNGQHWIRSGHRPDIDRLG